MNKASFSYESLEDDIELEIFGIRFVININEDYLRKLKDIENELDDNDSDEKTMEKGINLILGKDAYAKIKEKYEKDLNKSINNYVWLKVIKFVGDQITLFFKKVEDEVIEPINRDYYRRKNQRYRRNYRKRNRRY